MLERPQVYLRNVIGPLRGEKTNQLVDLEKRHKTAHRYGLILGVCKRALTFDWR